MQHLTISLDGIDGARLRHDWQWLLSGLHRLLAVTRMGDAFVENADGEVIFLDTLEGALKHAATNQNAFFKLLKAGELGPTWLNSNLVRRRRRGTSLPRGSRLAGARPRRRTRAPPEHKEATQAPLRDLIHCCSFTFARSALHLATHGRTIHRGTWLPH